MEEIDGDDDGVNEQLRRERIREMREGNLMENQGPGGIEDSQDMQNVLDFEDVKGSL